MQNGAVGKLGGEQTAPFLATTCQTSRKDVYAFRAASWRLLIVIVTPNFEIQIIGIG
jgi:hypothetical protein